MNSLKLFVISKSDLIFLMIGSPLIVIFILCSIISLIHLVGSNDHNHTYIRKCIVLNDKKQKDTHYER